jgi:hypothetical protein
MWTMLYAFSFFKTPLVIHRKITYNSPPAIVDFEKHHSDAHVSQDFSFVS